MKHTQDIFKHRKSSAGMTFIELTIVLFIMAIISGVALFNYGRFSGTISLQNTAQEVALTIKEAQRYAISGATLGGTTGLTAGFRPTYGVFFELSNNQGVFADADAAKKGFALFTDRPGGADRQLDGNICTKDGLSECFDLITIESGDIIEKICANDCKDEIGSKGPINISFTRPFPDAHFFVGGLPGDNLYTNIGIVVKSPRENQKTITIWKTGQVEVN